MVRNAYRMSHLQNSTPIMREILSDITTSDRIRAIAPDFHPRRRRATVFGRDGQIGSVLASRFTGKVSELPLESRQITRRTSCNTVKRRTPNIR